MPPYSAWSQAFLLQEQWWSEAARGVRGVARHHEEVVGVVPRQGLDMWSPSNFVATNPQVQQRTVAAGGANLVTGSANWARDALAVARQRPAAGVEQFQPGRDGGA